MFLTPSDAIGHIDSEKVKVNIRFELLRFIAKTLVDMNFTEADYLADNPSAKLTKGSTVHYTLASDYGTNNVETCLDTIKMLQRFEKGWRKPSEKTINSTKKHLVLIFFLTTHMTAADTLEILDEDKANTNKKLDEFKFVCKTLINYGVTDADFKKVFFSHITSNLHINSMVSCAYSQFLPEAYDLATYIDASDFAPYKSFWDRLFRREKMNDDLKAILNRILELYVYIVNQ